MTRLEAKLAICRAAIDSVFSETGVDLEETLAALRELQTELEMKIDALKQDIRRKRDV